VQQTVLHLIVSEIASHRQSVQIAESSDAATSTGHIAELFTDSSRDLWMGAYCNRPVEIRAGASISLQNPSQRVQLFHMHKLLKSGYNHGKRPSGHVAKKKWRGDRYLLLSNRIRKINNFNFALFAWELYFMTCGGNLDLQRVGPHV
jgi:hypothetical protein